MHGLQVLKGSIFLKNRYFIIQERFNKLIYSTEYDRKMWHLAACKISVGLSFLKWNDFYRISELMLATLIQGYDKKNHFSFDPVQKWEASWNFTGCQMPHFMIVLIPYINLLNLSWINTNKKHVFFFEEYGAFKAIMMGKL